jgi:hypothetical protein
VAGTAWGGGYQVGGESNEGGASPDGENPPIGGDGPGGGTGSVGGEGHSGGEGGTSQGGAGGIGGGSPYLNCLVNVSHCFDAAASCFEYSPGSDCDEIVDVCANMQADCEEPASF